MVQHSQSTFSQPLPDHFSSMGEVNTDPLSHQMLDFVESDRRKCLCQVGIQLDIGGATRILKNGALSTIDDKFPWVSKGSTHKKPFHELGTDPNSFWEKLMGLLCPKFLNATELQVLISYLTQAMLPRGMGLRYPILGLYKGGPLPLLIRTLLDPEYRLYNLLPCTTRQLMMAMEDHDVFIFRTERALVNPANTMADLQNQAGLGPTPIVLVKDLEPEGERLLSHHLDHEPASIGTSWPENPQSLEEIEAIAPDVLHGLLILCAKVLDRWWEEDNDDVNSRPHDSIFWTWLLAEVLDLSRDERHSLSQKMRSVTQGIGRHDLLIHL